MLENQCTGTITMVMMPYHVPSIVATITDSKGQCHYQYKMIVLAKVELTKLKEQHKTTKKKIAKTGCLNFISCKKPGYNSKPWHTLPDWGGSHRKSAHMSRRKVRRTRMTKAATVMNTRQGELFFHSTIAFFILSNTILTTGNTLSVT